MVKLDRSIELTFPNIHEILHNLVGVNVFYALCYRPEVSTWWTLVYSPFNSSYILRIKQRRRIKNTQTITNKSNTVHALFLNIKQSLA